MGRRQAKYNRRIRAERRNAGLCPDCGKDASGHHRCASCRAIRAEWAKSYRARLKERES